MRGSGKSTALSVIEKNLSKIYTDSTVVRIDLEDPRLAPRPKKETLELFSRAATDYHTKQQCWIVLDEADRVPGWLAWARDFKRRTGAGVIGAISGRPETNAADTDVAEIPFLPLGLRSWIENSTDKAVNISIAREMLPGYLRAGGLPLSWASIDRSRNLIRLFHEILFHDVIAKSEVRGVPELTAIAVYLASSTTESFSLAHMKGILTKSLDQARAFLAHLQRSGLVDIVSRIEDSGRERHGAARRTFAADCGLAAALASREVSERALAETAVLTELRRLHASVFAFRSLKRVGLAARDREGERILVQVEYDPEAARDTRPLARAMTGYDCRTGLLLSNTPDSDDIRVRDGIIARRPIWSWLLEPCLSPAFGASPDEKTVALKENAEPDREPESSGGLPSHLL